MKLLLPSSRLGPETFADLHVPPEADPGTLLVYLGGAVSSREYSSRRKSPPVDVLALLAGFSRPIPALVLSYPPALPGRPEAAAEAFLRHFREEVLPGLPVAPDRLSVVGYSLGAALVVLLARAEGARVVALATVGAVGAAEALAHPGPELGPLSCPVLVAWNTGDPCAPHSEGFVKALEAAGVVHEITRGEGGHGFGEYVGSGLMGAAAAFAWKASDLKPRESTREG
ncbi:MAG: dienelactone hydrolase family protein [Thermoanaerobaculia bacterium]